MIELIAFLGNYGNEYRKTRHNVAWILAESLELTRNLSWQHRFNGEYAKISCEKDNKSIHLIKPHTYMNLSGVSIAELASFYKISTESILVLHDEVELPLATVSLKKGGGLAGHNGLRSIKEKMGSADFWRLRIGIGRPAPKSEKNVNMAGYVLSSFSKDDLTLLDKDIPIITEILSLIVKGEELEAHLKNYAKCKVDLEES